MSNKNDNPDAKAAKIAGRQHGVLSLPQLESAGLDRGKVAYRAREGRLHRIHHGVYAVGHRRLSPEGRWLAAVLACGPGAVLSHVSAAGLWGLHSVILSPADVTVPYGSGRRGRRGIRIHRSQTLKTAEISLRNGIPVTNPSRTISDLRRCLFADQVRSVIRQAEADGYQLNEIEPVRTRSELEDRFLALCRKQRLPRPLVNFQINNFFVDFLWESPRLIVETDGYRFHRGRQAFEDNRARDAELRRLGFEVLRFSYRQVVGEPQAVAAAVRAALSVTG
jgi:very-short-patch-repair endonuclease